MVIELTKTFRFERKEESPDGSISGFATTYGNSDLVGDVIEKGAFSDWLKSNNKVKLLYGHDDTTIDNILGEAVFEDAEKGLLFDAQIDLELPNGQTAYKLVKKGLLDSVSVRFVSGNYTFKDKGGRSFKKAELRELSLVPFPANPKALITRIKSMNRSEITNIRDFEDFLRDSGFSKAEATAIASKGYKAVSQGEPDENLESLLKSLTKLSENLKGK